MLESPFPEGIKRHIFTGPNDPAIRDELKRFEELYGMSSAEFMQNYATGQFNDALNLHGSQVNLDIRRWKGLSLITGYTFEPRKTFFQKLKAKIIY